MGHGQFRIQLDRGAISCHCLDSSPLPFQNAAKIFVGDREFSVYPKGFALSRLGRFQVTPFWPSPTWSTLLIIRIIRIMLK